MPLLRILLFLACIAGYTHPAVAQSLQVGGQVGGMTLLMPNQGHLQPAGTQGNVFATYRLPRWRVGVQMGFRFTRWHDSTSFSPQASIPLQARIALDQQEMIHVFAGPYIGFGRDTMMRPKRPVRPRIRWGLTTGLDVRIPLSRRMVLVSVAEIDHLLPDLDSPLDPDRMILTPKRMLSFSLHVGIAYWFRSRKK